MPRAHRFFLPHHIWYLTHRCHRRDFLLKFARDRRREQPPRRLFMYLLAGAD